MNPDSSVMPWRNEPPHTNVWAMFDITDYGLACRNCGSLVPPSDHHAMLHADAETNSQWRLTLPDWAKGA